MNLSPDALQGARIVVPLPVIQENGGLWHQLTLSIIEGLRARGAEVFPFDMSYIHSGYIRDLFVQMPKLDEFKPDLVVVNSAVHALQCRTGSGVMANGRFVPNNLFVDNMKLPTVVIWDGIAEVFATLGFPSLDPTRSISGIIEALRDQINNPLFFHCFLDQDQVTTLRRLGVLTTPHVKHRLTYLYRPSEVYGRGPAEAGYDEDVVFMGNLFSNIPRRGEGAAAVIIEQMLQKVLARVDADICASYWEAIEAARAEIGEADCDSAKLHPDQSFFWEFVAFDVLGAFITRARINALRASRQPVSIYGLMFDPASKALLEEFPHLRFKRAEPFAALPRLNQRTKVTLDVVTSHLTTSITAKIAGCFAAGGLCLFNAKSAFRDEFGTVADQVMYRDGDDMNAKLDHLLTHDRERIELAEFFKAEMLEKYTYPNLVAELVAWVKETTPQRAA